MTETMIECVAIALEEWIVTAPEFAALAGAGSPGVDALAQVIRRGARSAIEAMREPDPWMILAGVDALADGKGAIGCYHAMIDAALGEE